jgi:hypothetical protein
MYEDAGVNDRVIQKIIEYKKQYAAFGKLVTAEQQNALDQWIDILVKAENEKDLWVQKIANLDEYRKRLGYLTSEEYNALGKEEKETIALNYKDELVSTAQDRQDYKNLTGDAQAQAQWDQDQREQFEDDLVVLNSNIQDIIQVINTAITELEGFRQQPGNTKDIDYAENAYNVHDSILEKIYTSGALNLLGASPMSEKRVDAIEDLDESAGDIYQHKDKMQKNKEAYQKAKEAGKDVKLEKLKATDIEEIQGALDSTLDTLNLLKETANKTSKEIGEHVDTVTNQMDHSMETLETNIKVAQAPIEETLKSLDATQTIETLLGVTGIVSQLGFILNNVANA